MNGVALSAYTGQKIKDIFCGIVNSDLDWPKRTWRSTKLEWIDETIIDALYIRNRLPEDFDPIDSSPEFFDRPWHVYKATDARATMRRDPLGK